MKNKQARKMIESVSGANFIFDAAPRGYSTTGAFLWVLDGLSFYESIIPNTEKSIHVNRVVSLTTQQLKEIN